MVGVLAWQGRASSWTERKQHWLGLGNHPGYPRPGLLGKKREDLKCQVFESPSPWQRIGTKGQAVSRLWLCKAERRKEIFYFWGGSVRELGCSHVHDHIEVLRLCPPPHSQGP